MNTPADKPDLPAPECECGQGFNPMYSDDTVRQLLADERRKALTKAAQIADGYPGAHSDDIARDIRTLIDRKEPT
jgi:hypothetical protein